MNGPHGAGRGGPRPPVEAVWNSFAWQIALWDATKVEAELRKRGLNPVADTDGKGRESFHVKDPDGFDVQLTNSCQVRARKAAAGKASLAVIEPLAATR